MAFDLVLYIISEFQVKEIFWMMGIEKAVVLSLENTGILSYARHESQVGDFGPVLLSQHSLQDDCCEKNRSRHLRYLCIIWG